ncbi:MAG TPA: nitrous oxide reductase accessory protein NosL [Lacibacter sp.]|nr:nitrous oxide reductase accessory protein NosL [Lacibacter sp.]HMO89285.1 nitrous oxide reductase accessory protein NosL [Lacibacter sp.]HMP85774.1 nitrous oxide reductase accessory protein NosL [Lacibacter sp.]
MNSKLLPTVRLISLTAGLALAISLLFPLWRIDLAAPQYPEGLTLKIYPHKIGGDVNVVNGLNHYIGMRTLHTEDFFEFVILPYLIGAFALFGILTWLVNRRWFFYTWTVLFIMFGVIAMFDFYRWEYNYGHNLDPSAPIVVPGMAYQPPLIGYKQLLNFGAWSFPDVGGYIFLVVGLMLVVGVWMEWKNFRKAAQVPASLIMTTLLIVLTAGCQTGSQPIRFGQDACHFCKMIITDQRFGAEVVSDKGKVFKFDDTHCLFRFLKSGQLSQAQVAGIYVVDYGQKEKLIPAATAFWLQGDAVRGPMGGTLAALETAAARESVNVQLKAKPLAWDEIVK